MPPSPREVPLAESDARLIAYDFRQQFRNSEAFEAAWQALFELKSSITPSLARRFMGEELLKYRARLAGLEDAPGPPPLLSDYVPQTYRCPGCQRDLSEWSRLGHAEDCRHAGCYALEVRFREAKQRQKPRSEQVDA